MCDYACIRCGMCCLIAPCGYSEEEERYGGNCPYLTLNDDNTTTCHNEDAKATFIGSGCRFQNPGWPDIYTMHLDDYAIDKRKQTLKRFYDKDSQEFGKSNEQH